MKTLSQGMLLLTAVIISVAAAGGTVQSCAYKHDVRPYPLVSCRSQTAYVSLCLASELKYYSKVTWPTPAAMQAAQVQILAKADERTSSTINKKQQLVASCQFSRGIDARHEKEMKVQNIA